jgi:hypothetical protein
MASLEKLKSPDRDRLRREWLERAGQIFERMFAEDQQKDLVTFTQREDRAVDLGQELAKWLIEEHLAADAAAQPSRHEAAVACTCPKCGKPGVAVTGEADPLPGRQLVSRAGEVGLERERYRCTICRIVFFPPGPEAGADGRGVQSGGGAEGGASGR